MSGQWFVMSGGERAGEVRMAGWARTALRLVDDGSRTYTRMGGMVGLAVCPRCAAIVLADSSHAYGDQTAAHEQWHAATDWPVPPELRSRPAPA